MDSIQHSAPAAAAGYLYQCQAALLELVTRGWETPELVMFLETLDDVEIQAGDAREALQIKHHAARGGNLRDLRVDLWRTIDDLRVALQRGRDPRSPGRQARPLLVGRCPPWLHNEAQR